MSAHLLRRCIAVGRTAAQRLRARLQRMTKPATGSLCTGTLADLVRSKPELIAENALLRQQLIILRRSVRRPHCTRVDRALLVLLAGRLHSWRQSLPIVQPDTLLRWHRNLFRRFWRRKSCTARPAHRPPITPETIALIRAMAAANRTWGAERIRGEWRRDGSPRAGRCFRRSRMASCCAGLAGGLCSGGRRPQPTGMTAPLQRWLRGARCRSHSRCQACCTRAAAAAR